MSKRSPLLALTLAIVSVLCLQAKSTAPRQLKWESLSSVVGKTVSIAMPGGAIVTGRAASVESDALVVRVTRTADASAYPKGPLRMPRATLHTLELRTKGVKFRVIGTVLGGAAGFAAGIVSAIAISGGLFRNDNPGGANAALIGITAALAGAGYLLGNAADRQWETVEIIP